MVDRSTPDEASDKCSILNITNISSGTPSGTPSGNSSGTPSGPLKKDPSPVCGYQSGPLKKDGTPDMRYAAYRR
jgi:hypothetical protein